MTAREQLDAYAAQTALFTMATRADEKYPQLFAALGAVLDLHGPETVDADPQLCTECCPYENDWPCPTVRAITNALAEQVPGVYPVSVEDPFRHLETS